MSFIGPFFWWLIPTWAIATALRRFEWGTAERWCAATVTWAAGSGALTWLSIQILGARGLSRLHWSLPVVIVALASVWYLRRKSFLPLHDATGREAGQMRLSIRDGLGLASVTLTLFVFSGQFAGGLAAVGAASEYYAYATVARTWLSERVPSPEVFGALSAGASMPIAGWSRLGGAAAAGGWSYSSDVLLVLLLLTTSVLTMMQRMRALGLPMVAGMLVVALMLAAPEFARFLARHSDLGIVALLSAVVVVALLGPGRDGFALLLASAGFAWNPTLGWPLALSTAVIVGLRRAQPHWSWLVVGLACVVLMVLQQARVLLPTAWQSALPLSTHPLMDWPTLGRGGWLAGLFVVALALAALRMATSYSRAHHPSVAHVSLWTILTLIAFTLTWPSYLGTTDWAFTNLLLVALAPAWIAWACLHTSIIVQPLSAYQPEGVAVRDSPAPPETVAQDATPESSGVQQPATAGTVAGSQSAPLPHAIGSAAHALGLGEELTLEESRAILLEGFNFLQTGQLEDAKLRARAILEFDPQHPDANHLLALVALQENRPGDALRDVLKAIEVYPEHALFHLTVAEIYGMQNRFEEQALALQEASRLDPGNVAIKTRLLLAKRKALLKAAQRAGSPSASDHRYEIIVAENEARRTKSE